MENTDEIFCPVRNVLIFDNSISYVKSNDGEGGEEEVFFGPRNIIEKCVERLVTSENSDLPSSTSDTTSSQNSTAIPALPPGAATDAAPAPPSLLARPSRIAKPSRIAQPKKVGVISVLP